MPSLVALCSLGAAIAAAAPVLAEERDAISTENNVSVEREIDVQAPLDTEAVKMRAEQMTGRPARILNLDGRVEIVRGKSIFDADTAEYHAVEDLVMANGHIKMRRGTDCYWGDTLQMQLDTGAGYLTNPIYRMGSRNGQGHAKRLEFIDSDRSVIEQGTYTTCEGAQPDWYLYSSRLSMDSEHEEGVALDTVVYFKQVPILASPWISFPTSDARRSGLLPPEFSSTTTGGAELAVPYYLNIAPNRDATLIPRYISKRGLQLGGEYRYLEPNYDGIFKGAITPNDRLTDSKRYLYGYIHKQTLSPGLTMNLNYNRASDDQYAVDYSHSIADSSQHLLPQEFTLNYWRPWGTVGLHTANYQVLQNADNSIGKPYAILPKLYFLSGDEDFGGINWSVNSEYARFRSSTQPDGERLAVNGQISYPITGIYYFITPKVLYHLSEYRLGRNFIPGSSTNPTLSVPTFALDSGLFFEKETSLFGREIIQTLEPRLFYLRTPFRYQADIPLFDTGVKDINFSQIFTENRFSGQDRVGDANQLTAALISRIIETDGQERFSFGAAQRISFSQPEVVANPFFTERQVIDDEVNFINRSTLPSRSDLFFFANGKVTDTISADAVWRYSQSQHDTAQLNYGLKWRPAPMKVVNFQYRYLEASEVNPELIRQVDISAQWPLAARWYGVARTNYSIADRRILDGLVGFEHRQDCWIVRAVVQRYLVPSTVPQITTSAVTSFFLQLELSGLSRLGSNPIQAISRSIPGYQPVTQPYMR